MDTSQFKLEALSPFKKELIVYAITILCLLPSKTDLE
jgi:hypothetical protein